MKEINKGSKKTVQRKRIRQNEKSLGRQKKELTIAEPTEGLSGMRLGQSSSTNCSGEVEQQLEENKKTQSHIYKSASGGSVDEFSSSQDDNSSFESNQGHGSEKLKFLGKKIKKEKTEIRKRTPRRTARITPERRRTTGIRKINHKKYTVKTVSNFLRKELKTYAFDFSCYESKGTNKRGTRIYFNLMLLELKHRKGKNFSKFIDFYLKELDRMIQVKVKEQFTHGITERNVRYIEDFEKAKIAAKKFREGDYQGSIKIFFGQGKELFYMVESIIYFNGRKKEIGDNTPMIDNDETNEVNEVKNSESANVEGQMLDEDIFDVLDLDWNMQIV